MHHPSPCSPRAPRVPISRCPLRQGSTCVHSLPVCAWCILSLHERTHGDVLAVCVVDCWTRGDACVSRRGWVNACCSARRTSTGSARWTTSSARTRRASDDTADYSPGTRAHVYLLLGVPTHLPTYLPTYRCLLVSEDNSFFCCWGVACAVVLGVVGDGGCPSILGQARLASAKSSFRLLLLPS